MKTSPSVGRIVHYYPGTTDRFSSAGPLAAVIVRVWGDECVNLTVFDGDGAPHTKTSALLWQGVGERPGGGYAKWPDRPDAGVMIPLPVVETAPAPSAPTTQVPSVAPRVMPEQIDALVDKLTYLTSHYPGTTITTAVAVLPDGFVAGMGMSATVSKPNFNAEIGKQIAIKDARENARTKLWELEGYLLRDRLRQPDNAT